MGNRNKRDIVPIGIPPKVGDQVISYYDDRENAYQGVMTKLNKDGQAFVEFLDGDTAWVDSTFVYKLIPMK
jgi:hypothetical protein